MASSAPAGTVGLTLAALAVATAYGSGPILVLTAISMLIIANAYRRLNLWKASTGASFEWVGHRGAGGAGEAAPTSHRAGPSLLNRVSPGPVEQHVTFGAPGAAPRDAH